MKDWTLAEALGIRDGSARCKLSSYRVVVRDLVVPFRVGVYEHEKQRPQRVRVNVELTVAADGFSSDRLGDVLNYEFVVAGIMKLAGEGHIELVETLAERIAGLCFGDPRVEATRIQVEKLDVFPEAESVGVLIEHRRIAAEPAG